MQHHWDAHAYFTDLISRNRLAQAHGFTVRRVSGLNGFEEFIQTMQTRMPAVCVTDCSEGYTELNNTGHTRRLTTLFIFMPHLEGDMEARARCLATMRELHRQLLTAVTVDKHTIARQNIFLEQRIPYEEIDRYFFASGACAWFQIAYSIYTDLRYRQEEWLPKDPQ